MRLLAIIIVGVLLLDLFSSSEAWWWGRRCHQPKTSRGNWFPSSVLTVVSLQESVATITTPTRTGGSSSVVVRLIFASIATTVLLAAIS